MAKKKILPNFKGTALILTYNSAKREFYTTLYMTMYLFLK